MRKPQKLNEADNEVADTAVFFLWFGWRRHTPTCVEYVSATVYARTCREKSRAKALARWNNATCMMCACQDEFDDGTE